MADTPAIDTSPGLIDYADPAFWATVGLFIFLFFLMWRKVPGTIGKSLDDRAARITSELANAEALRKEAEAKLADAERRQAEAEAQAKLIVESAHREAQLFAESAARTLEETAARRQKTFEERIARAEAEAIRDVRLAAVETASRAAQTLLAEQLTGKAADEQFSKSLAAVSKALS